jgi:hypothetical protein
MLAFWLDVLQPILTDLRPRSIVEIGSESGKMTQRLVELARDIDARVHAIDPAPRFDVEAVTEKLGDVLTVHTSLSLEVIPTLDRLDAVLIDGDHNWYTVFHELMAVEKRARQLGQVTPLIVLHDVCWPYGRRDLYYDPTTIPEEHRQPWARRGISPTEKQLMEVGGFNPHLCHAREEGGPHNGVWTAVEDYLDRTEVPFTVAKIPAVFGLAILLPSERADERPRLAERVAAWQVPEVVGLIDRMETARIAMMMGITAVPK